MWGIYGTAKVLTEYTDKASPKGFLLEPLNEKRERIGFVHAPTRDGRCCNPFKTASAYRK